jgi:hypothetical protein
VTLNRTVRGPVLSLVAAAMALSSLSGCDTHPGAAAVVGSESISQGRLDDVALALCSAQSASSPQALAGRAAREGALSVMVSSELSRQFGRAMGVDPDQSQVSAAVTANQSTIDKLPASRRSAFTDTLRTYAEGQLVVIAVGRRALLERGTKSPTADQAVAVGTALRDAWVKKHLKVTVDPRYGRFTKGSLVTSSGSLSVPVSAIATAGAKAQPDASWVSALPASQQCG